MKLNREKAELPGLFDSDKGLGSQIQPDTTGLSAYLALGLRCPGYHENEKEPQEGCKVVPEAAEKPIGWLDLRDSRECNSKPDSRAYPHLVDAIASLKNNGHRKRGAHYFYRSPKLNQVVYRRYTMEKGDWMSMSCNLCHVQRDRIRREEQALKEERTKNGAGQENMRHQ